MADNIKSSKKRKVSRNMLKGKQPSLFNNVFFYIFIIIGIYLLFSSFADTTPAGEEKPISDVITQINDGKVQDITVDRDNISVLLTDGTRISSKKESTISFDEILSNNNVDRSKIQGEINVKQSLSFEEVIIPILSLAVPILILFFIFRQMKGAGGEIFSFGRSRAREITKGKSKITFNDVAGNEEAKKELMEIVDFLKHPQKYRKLGARIPKGVLLVGSAGVGKTLLAKAVAGEADVPFFSVAGSEFMEMLVGVGSARARDLFQRAKAAQPSLIFIDEIDAIGRQRGMGIGGGHDEREQTLNQILIEMDGFDERTDVIVLAATNRPDMLDPALVRPGRFDRRVVLPMPDLKDREAIIKIHMRGKPIAQDVDVEKVAKKTVGFSGADLENMLNEAAILAARSDKTEIDKKDIDEASLKVTMGSERRTLQTEEDRKMTAYHEGGHAIVGAYMPDMDPVQRVSIVARGGSLGHTSLPPQRDRYNETKTRLLSMIATMLGGRAAEEIVFGEFTTGASDDLDKATSIARKIVKEYGMSELGPISYKGDDMASPWLAREVSEGPHYSEQTAYAIDQQVTKVISEAYQKAKDLVNEHRKTLDTLADRLLEKETLDEDEFASLINE